MVKKMQVQKVSTDKVVKHYYDVEDGSQLTMHLNSADQAIEINNAPKCTDIQDNKRLFW